MKNLLNVPTSRGNRRSFVKKQSATGTATKVATLLLAVVAVAAFHPTPVSAQSFCGPTTPINFNSSNGSYPFAGVTFDSLGNMYGTTSNGGASGFGTVWKYTSSAGLTQLFNFSGSSSPSNNGDRPMTPLLADQQGNLYGATSYGGNNFSGEGTGWGTLFKLSSSGQFTELYQFSGPDGANPIGAVLLDSAGNLWGTTYQGGSAFNNLGNDGYGTIFKYSGGTVTNPVLFNITDGENANGGMATDGTSYYGTTYQGGANSFGTLFQYNSATGQLTTLFDFNRFPNGSYPSSAVIYDGKGNLYGTTSQGGGHSGPSNACCGTVWKYSLSSGTLTTLVSFDGDTVPPDGMFPQGGVTLDGNGNLYGTASQGGTFSDGIVYEFSSTGTLSTLATFSGSNGQFPEGNLAFDSAGNLWGITHQGGNPGYGTVYELTPNTGSGCGPSVSSVTLNPPSIPNGHSTTGTVTLSAAAPSGGSVVGLTSDNGSVFPTLPSSVTVPAGATSANFQATANNLFVLSNTVVTFTATLGNSTAQGTVTVTPGINVASISLNPSSVTAGSTSTGTVTLTAAAPSGGDEVLVSVSHNNPADPNPPVLLPIIVTVAAGQRSATFTLGTTNDSSNLTFPVFAQSGTTTASTNFTVKPCSSCPHISSLTLNPTSVQGGATSTGTVTLSANAPSGGAVVVLSTGNFLVATVPPSVIVAAGSTSATFTVSTTSVSTTTNVAVSGTYSGQAQSATLTVTPPGAVTISSLTLNPSSVTGGNSSTGTVTLSGIAPSGGAVVTLTSGNTSVATVPSSVTVAAGNTSATFSVSTTTVSSSTNVAISGTYGGANQSANLTVTPASVVTLSSLTLNPHSVTGGNSSTGTVTLSGNAPSGGAVVTLTSGNTSVATVPSSVTVPAGSTSATFTVSTQRVSQNTNVTISGTYGGTQSATLTVTSGHHH
jgi:uncharacterized repeat protein (TIGR03803 family)